jgi:hypothetical protein
MRSQKQNTVTKVTAGTYHIQTLTQRFEVKKLDSAWFLFTYSIRWGRSEQISAHQTLREAKAAAFQHKATAG